MNQMEEEIEKLALQRISETQNLYYLGSPGSSTSTETLYDDRSSTPTLEDF